MKIVCLQMDMQLGHPDENFAHAGQMICDLSMLTDIRNTIPVFRDRKTNLYNT